VGGMPTIELPTQPVKKLSIQSPDRYLLSLGLRHRQKQIGCQIKTPGVNRYATDGFSKR
jgi:hypothetical protein